MRKNGQISDEAREGVAVVVTSGSHQKPHHTRKKMAGGMGLSMRRELLELMLPQYQEAVPVDKRQVLEEFTRLTGYHRRYAMFLFNHHTGQRSKPAKPSCSRRYDSKVEEALVLIWNYATRVWQTTHSVSAYPHQVLRAVSTNRVWVYLGERDHRHPCVQLGSAWADANGARGDACGEYD